MPITERDKRGAAVVRSRIYYDCHEDVLSSLKRLKVQNQEVQDKIDTFYNYLVNHGENRKELKTKNLTTAFVLLNDLQ